MKRTNRDDWNGWKEAAIAWSVCASIHREYAKGKDPFFKTRQKDFVKHENDAREKMNEQRGDVGEGQDLR